MNKILYLFLPQAHELHSSALFETVQWVYSDINNEIKYRNGNLSEVALLCNNYQITVVIPGENILFFQSEIPGKNSQQVRQAVPYVLEDNLIDDVEDLHFSIKKISENKYDVAIINKILLEKINEQLSYANIQPFSITADYLLLKNDNTLLCDAGRGVYSGKKIRFATSNLNKELLSSSIEKDQQLKIIRCENNNVDLKNMLDIVDASEIECDAPFPVCLVKNSLASSQINLLQGEFQKKRKWAKIDKKWWPAAALFFIWLSVQGGLLIFDYVRLSQQSQILKNEVNQIYKKTFPQAKRIVNAKAQMQQQLSILQKRSGKNEYGFTQMLASSAAALSAAQGLKIKSLRYYDGRINLEVTIASLQALEKLKDQLSEQHGYLVEIQNASSDKNIVTARLKITGKAS